MADAQVYLKTTPDPTKPDKAVILNVRAWEAQPFVAPNWMDLRVGFFLSLTSEAGNDDPAALGESIGDGIHLLGQADRYFLGLVDTATGGTGIGFTNSWGRPLPGKSELVSSDAGVGTTTADYWRPRNATTSICAAILDGGQERALIRDNAQQHFPQVPANTGGYAVLLGMQLLRDNPNSRTIRVNIKSSPKSADMLYSNTPNLDVLRAALQTWPPSQQMGPVTVSNVPNAFYFYWPFRQSRLRIHSYGILKPK